MRAAFSKQRTRSAERKGAMHLDIPKASHEERRET